jgi:hypothetical protein
MSFLYEKGKFKKNVIFFNFHFKCQLHIENCKYINKSTKLLSVPELDPSIPSGILILAAEHQILLFAMVLWSSTCFLHRRRNISKDVIRNV